MIDATLVTIHGFWSSPAAWGQLDAISGCLQGPLLRECLAGCCWSAGLAGLASGEWPGFVSRSGLVVITLRLQSGLWTGLSGQRRLPACRSGGAGFPGRRLVLRENHRLIPEEPRMLQSATPVIARGLVPEVLPVVMPVVLPVVMPVVPAVPGVLP